MLSFAGPDAPFEIALFTEATKLEFSASVRPDQAYTTTADAEAALSQLLGRNDVIAADYNRWGQALASAPPNDPAFRDQQSAIEAMAMCCFDRDAWDLSSGQGVVVAVLDSGTAHVGDLMGRLLPQQDFYPAPRKVFTEPGWVDPRGHGTEVASVISAIRNNRQGTAGATERSMVLPVRISDGAGGIRDDSIARAVRSLIRATTEEGEPLVHVMNMSWDRPPNRVVAEAIGKAIEAGIVVVASAGNCENQSGSVLSCRSEDDTSVTFPASVPGVISVGAASVAVFGGALKPADYSHFGKNLDLWAQGGEVFEIPAVGRTGETMMSKGTSIAAPFVSASVASGDGELPTIRSTASGGTFTYSDRGVLGEDGQLKNGNHNYSYSVTALFRQTDGPGFFRESLGSPKVRVFCFRDDEDQACQAHYV